MKAAIWNEAGSLDVKSRDVPEPRPGQVRLKVGACGICGSDLHFYGVSPCPLAKLQPGHEMAGFIDALGDGVELQTGSLVAVEPLVSCKQCPSCLTGHYNRCVKAELIGFHRRGGLAEYVEVPATCVHVLPSDLDLGITALAEPLAVSIRGVRLGQVGVGKRVGVLGAGSIGLLSIAAAKVGGARSVHVTARHPQQAELAHAFGADEVYSDIDTMVASVGDTAYDVVLETVGGDAETLVEAAAVAAPGATIVMLGVFNQNTPIASQAFFQKELRLVASNCYAYDDAQGDFALATELLPSIGDTISPMITHRYSLDETILAFDAAKKKSSGSIKVQIQLQ